MYNRFKDRMCRTSQLTKQESFNFQAALHRFWLFSRIYGIWEYEHEQDNLEEDEDEDEEDIQDDDMLDAVQKKIHDFLQSFSTKELDELQRIVHFLEDAVGWALRSDWEEFTGHYGPVEGLFELLHNLPSVESFANLEYFGCRLQYRPSHGPPLSSDNIARTGRCA